MKLALTLFISRLPYRLLLAMFVYIIRAPLWYTQVRTAGDTSTNIHPFPQFSVIADDRSRLDEVESGAEGEELLMPLAFVCKGGDGRVIRQLLLSCFCSSWRAFTLISRMCQKHLLQSNRLHFENVRQTTPPSFCWRLSPHGGGPSLADKST